MAYLFRVNTNVVPSYAKPTRVLVEYPKPARESVNLLGRPVGAAGYPWATLEFDRLTLQGFQWWNDLVPAGAASVQLTDLVLPNPWHDGSVTQSLVVYANHQAWTAATLWRIRIEESAGMRPLSTDAGANYANWVDGFATVLITELGRS